LVCHKAPGGLRNAECGFRIWGLRFELR
jgi:hypothetical protein